MQQRFLALKESLGLDKLPARLECFDISHSSGEATVASCVVFDRNGPQTSHYRKFNITDITPGDDYAAMAQAIERRYMHPQKQADILPDILIIDGGKGQLQKAKNALERLQIDQIKILAIAKGITRKPGLESLFLDDNTEFVLSADHPALHLLQHIRDEAHRFAIHGHRAKRDKKRTQSVLQNIDGVGPKRRQALLKHFGGLQEVSSASIEEITKVDGINHKTAQIIYDSLHSN